MRFANLNTGVSTTLPQTLEAALVELSQKAAQLAVCFVLVGVFL
jgi:hypothetical protein